MYKALAKAYRAMRVKTLNGLFWYVWGITSLYGFVIRPLLLPDDPLSKEIGLLVYVVLIIAEFSVIVISLVTSHYRHKRTMRELDEQIEQHRRKWAEYESKTSR